jgi:hypothetical protein
MQKPKPFWVVLETGLNQSCFQRQGHQLLQNFYLLDFEMMDISKLVIFICYPEKLFSF